MVLGTQCEDVHTKFRIIKCIDGYEDLRVTLVSDERYNKKVKL